MQKLRKIPWRLLLKIFGVLGLIIISNLFFQLTQNEFSFELMFKFAFFLAYGKILFRLFGITHFLRLDQQLFRVIKDRQSRLSFSGDWHRNC